MALAQVDLELLHELVVNEPLAAAEKQFGGSGTKKVKEILRFLKRCARYATVHEKSDVTVFGILQPDTLVDQQRLAHANPFHTGVSALGSINTLAVEIRDDGSAFVWTTVPPEVVSVMQTGIVYRLQQCVETFLIHGTVLPVQKVISGAVSQFCVNYFLDLKEALVAYRDSMARTSKCHLLREAWVDDNRFWFTTKPEYRLRRALHNHLYSYLRHDEIDLREEQNVDDSHPVDIKIVWRMENRSAIIEVKWLGRSLDIATKSVTATHSAGRAREGAKQLAEYLEEHRQQAAKEDTRGYLVIFDCRRRGMKPTDTILPRAKGLYYANQEIPFSPEYHKERSDFEEPIRMFLEPVCI